MVLQQNYKALQNMMKYCMTGEPSLKGRLSTLDLLIKVACFVKKETNVGQYQKQLI
jgi:hypothetical protein